MGAFEIQFLNESIIRRAAKANGDHHHRHDQSKYC